MHIFARTNRYKVTWGGWWEVDAGWGGGAGCEISTRPDLPDSPLSLSLSLCNIYGHSIITQHLHDGPFFGLLPIVYRT